MTDLTAVDIMIQPDTNAIERAREVNRRMPLSIPAGITLDDTHLPHIHHHAAALPDHRQPRPGLRGDRRGRGRYRRRRTELPRAGDHLGITWNLDGLLRRVAGVDCLVPVAVELVSGQDQRDGP